MVTAEAKEFFRNLAADFFCDYVVIYAHQSRIPKPSIPLVTLSFGNVKRPQAANYEIVDGEPVGNYLSRMAVTVDLFTNGSAIKVSDGTVIGYGNTAMDEILCFADYINGQQCLSECFENDVSLLIESDAQDLTDIVNDTNYEYRSRLEVMMYFTQSTDDTIGIENTGFFTAAEITDESQ